MYNYYDNTICSADVVSESFANIMPEVAVDNYKEENDACVFTVIDKDSVLLYYNLYKKYDNDESLGADVVKLCEAGHLNAYAFADENETNLEIS